LRATKRGVNSLQNIGLRRTRERTSSTGPLQLPVAAVGTGLAAFGYRALVGLLSPGTGGPFGPAVALLALSLVIRAGLFLLPLGLLTPPTGGYGIEVDDSQRRLLMCTAVTVAVGPFVGVGMASVTPWIVPQTDAHDVCGAAPVVCHSSLACRGDAPVTGGIGRLRIGVRGPNGPDRTIVSLLPTLKPPRGIHRPPTRPSIP
jgi:hypothetical protein